MTGMLPLDGMRVVEFGQLIGAPNAAMILAELGADVIKVEPLNGDAGRELQSAAFAGSGTSPTFQAFNRDKRSIALDLKHPTGQAIAEQLVAAADVMIESSRPGAMERCGLGSAQVRARHPHLVHASLSGFGAHGPDRERRGVDMVIQAESGIMSVTGEEHGPPMKVGFTVVDVAAGHVMAQAILAALVRRGRTGDGDAVEVSLLEVALHLQAAPISEFLATGTVPPRRGNSAPMTAPADLFQTQDGELVISAYLDHHWRALCDVIERPELVNDPRFITKVDRVRNREALTAELAAALSARSSAAWLDVLGAAGLVVGEVRDYAHVVRSDQVRALGAIVDVPDGHGGTYGTVRLPARSATWTAAPPTAPPSIGEHSVDVLTELGWHPDEIERAIASGAVRQLPPPVLASTRPSIQGPSIQRPSIQRPSQAPHHQE